MGKRSRFFMYIATAVKCDPCPTMEEVTVITASTSGGSKEVPFMRAPSLYFHYFSCSLWGKFGQIKGQSPHLWNWSRETLDPPRSPFSFFSSFSLSLDVNGSKVTNYFSKLANGSNIYLMMFFATRACYNTYLSSLCIAIICRDVQG